MTQSCLSDTGKGLVASRDHHRTAVLVVLKRLECRVDFAHEWVAEGVESLVKRSRGESAPKRPYGGRPTLGRFNWMMPTVSFLPPLLTMMCEKSVAATAEEWSKRGRTPEASARVVD